MNLIKPKKLKLGDKIGVVANSGELTSVDELERAVVYIKNLGYEVVLARNVYDRDRYLAGNDDVKVEELHKMFLDETVNAIFSMRGGYGALRLVDKIDYEIVRKKPKIFIGFSDVSILSSMFLKKAGLITYSGPMLLSDFGVEDVDLETVNNCFEVLSCDKVLIYKPYEKVFSNGKNAKGITFGGNLASIVSLCGQDFLPDENFIFFIEDLNEPVYKIDKMLTQLKNISKFKKYIKGLVVGEFLDIDNQDWFEEVIKDFAEDLGIAVLGNFRITHRKKKITIPYGAKSEIKNGEFVVENL